MTGAAALRGFKATNYLLTGAKLVQAKTNFRQYVKRGTYKDVIRDFTAVNPMNVQTFQIPDAVGEKKSD